MKYLQQLKLPLLSLFGVFALTSTLAAQFTPPGMVSDPAEKANARAVSDPEAAHVQHNEDLDMDVVTSTNSEQDAINKAIDLVGKEGIVAIGTGSGLGFVSTATAEYQLSKNPNLTRNSQRAAAVRAMLLAKAALMEAMNEIEVEGLLRITESREAIDTEDASLENFDLHQAEAAKTHAKGLVRGAILYDLHDDPSSGSVRVSVVTTPKTRGQCSSGTGSNMLHASDLEDALGLIRMEIESGVVPPGGGKTVCLQDGSVAYIGFGSGLVRVEMDGSVIPGARRAAKEAAKAFAKKSLLAVIHGEEIEYGFEGGTNFKEAETGYEIAMNENGEDEMKVLAETEKEMISISAAGFKAEGIVKGKLPSGCVPMPCKGAEGWEVYAMVYHHQMAGELTKVGKEMAEKTFNATNQNAKTGFEINPDGSFKRDKNGKLVPASLGAGRVTKDKDL